MEKEIIKKPVLDIIDRVNKSSKNGILLAGVRGSGKSTVLDEYKEKNELIIDCTLSDEENLYIPDRNIFMLYHECLLIEKMSQYILKNYPLEFGPFFIFLNKERTILKDIKSMFLIANYDSKEEKLGEYYSNPESLFAEFTIEVRKVFKDKEPIVVVDKFDNARSFSSWYQIGMYELLKNRFKYIFTVSDIKLLNREDNKDYDIVDVNYSSNIDVVREILDKMIVNELVRTNEFDFRKRIIYFLSDEEIREIIDLFRGNIEYMYWAISSLVRNLDTVSKEEYMSYIRNYYEERKDIIFESENFKEGRLSI